MTETYDRHATELVRNVLPAEDLRLLVKTFLDSASVDMGSDYEETIIDRVVYILKNEYAYLPICFVASGFSQGAMGKYGPGRLVPRTIHIWMNEVSAEYNRKNIQDHQAELDNETLTTYDLVKYPVGKAIIQKIDWFKAGLLDGDRWDRVNLKQLAEAIGRKEEISFNKFFV